MMPLYTTNDLDAHFCKQGGLEYLGLAPFLRASIAGADLRLLISQMLQRLTDDNRNPELLMNLSIAAQCLNQKELGLEFQKEALSIQQTFTVPASVQPARIRLLILVAPGSIQSNTPLECLLEVSDIELIFHYVALGDDMLGRVPEHDLLFVGISDSDANRGLLQALSGVLEAWPRPVLNSPQYLPLTGRDRASELLQNIPNLLAPVTRRISRAQLEALTSGNTTVEQLLDGCDFPIILRPLGSQAGVDLEKIDNPKGVSQYLARLKGDDFFMAPFIDYSDAHGQFRKIRIALIDGEAFVCHMAVSSNWMIHYVNAGMYAEEWKRREEATFMNEFQGFVKKHKAALDAISQRMQLEYLVMDCAETLSGDLLLFEIDHGGVVHAMDVESIFPYKNEHVHKAQKAFSALLTRLLPQNGQTGIPNDSRKIQ
jgi:glutathione synthase/RimK-type ligase-like ATP-grasp enzyme